MKIFIARRSALKEILRGVLRSRGKIIADGNLDLQKGI